MEIIDLGEEQVSQQAVRQKHLDHFEEGIPAQAQS